MVQPSVKMMQLGIGKAKAMVHRDKYRIEKYCIDTEVTSWISTKYSSVNKCEEATWIWEKNYLEETQRTIHRANRGSYQE